MAEKEEQKAGEEKAKKTSAGGSESAADETPAGEEAAAEKPTAEEEVKPSPDEEPAEVPGEEEPRPGPREEEGEMSEEEFRRLVEESLEKVTVADIALTMMNQLASVGYMKMGLPENVNLKYRDLDQARLAIDILDAILKGAEGKVAEEMMQPFKGTLANLQMNYFKLSRGQG